MMMLPENPTPDDVIAAALATGKSHAQAAVAANVSRSTVWRRMQEPEFRRKVDYYRRFLISQTLGLFAAAAPDAAARLHLLISDEQSPHVQLSAARSVIEMLTKLQTAETLEERLLRLEEQYRGLIGRADGPPEPSGA